MNRLFKSKSALTTLSFASSLATFNDGAQNTLEEADESKFDKDSLLDGQGGIRHPNLECPKTKPFELTWTFGYTCSMPVINLSYGTHHEIFYIASNVGIIYNYCSKEMYHLKGHVKKIVSAAIDRSGRWLATAENGEENVILLWDTIEKKLVWTIFDQPTNPAKIILLGLSPSAKLLVTVSQNESDIVVQCWLWTQGNKEPEACHVFDEMASEMGLPKAIEFNPNKEEHFMVVCEDCVVFFTWDAETNELYDITIPSVLARNVGHYTNGTYVEMCHECFVSTSKGAILVFGNTIYTKPTAEKFENKKKFIKNIQVSKSAINCITSIDGVIVTVSSEGRILFFDKWLKLLYWFSKTFERPIVSVSFKLSPRKYHIQDFYTEEDYEETGIIPDCDNQTEDYEVIFANQVPQDASLKKFPFISRDFFISTELGCIYAVNFMKKEFIPVFSCADASIAAIDVHDELPHIIVAYKSGHLAVFNYDTHEEVMSTVVPIFQEEDYTKVSLTAVKYSKQGLHLACGKSNGELWMLQSAALSQIYVSPFRYGTKKIQKIIFAINSLQMAYYDEGMTVFAFAYDQELEDWVFKGKVRSHYKEICNILFLDEPPYSLYSLGKDRHIIKYTDLGVNDEELDCVIRDRVEQRDIPLYFIHYPNDLYSQSEYFLLSDNRHKFKKVSAKTHVTTSVFLGPAHGCFRNNPVRKMEFIPKTDKKFLVMMNNKDLGIQLMPIDGNPFKFFGVQAHPVELLDFKIEKEGRYVFTVGKGDRCIFKWRIKKSSVRAMHKYGGQELQPYYCLLEGGRNGYQFQEMRDLFYYMQILQQGENVSLPRVVTNSINISELPDLVKSCGYFPSEYEIENLLIDARYKDYDKTCTTREKITFCDFVKLFINHKPAHGYSMTSVQEAFDAVADFCEGCYPGTMTREYFVEAITTSGEMMTEDQLYRCMVTLLHLETYEEAMGTEKSFGFLPNNIDFDVFVDEILGIDMQAHEVDADVGNKGILEDVEEEVVDKQVCV